ncbi:MAG: histidine kinase [Syntrophomonadaceae bacterium]|nr:histidine kinase [Syntrophomonadaceae bacterium]
MAKSLTEFSFGRDFVNRFIPALSVHFSKIQNQEIVPEQLLHHALGSIRFLLFFLTSAFYLAEPLEAPFSIKIMVVITMLAATLLAQSLYDDAGLQKLRNNTTVPKARRDINLHFLSRLIVIESIGIALLLLPTGGLDSPFAWYALNPVIAAAVFLPGFVCWGVLGVFLAAAMAASAVYPGINGSFFSFVAAHMSVLLVYFFSTSLVQVAAALFKQLTIAYERLNQAHAAAERSLEHISSLYQSLEVFTSSEDHRQLAEVLAVYAARLCERPAACMLRRNLEEGAVLKNPLLRVANRPENDGIDWEKEMQRAWKNITPGREESIHLVSPASGHLVARLIVSHGEYCGILAYLEPPWNGQNQGESMKSLVFLAELGGIIMGRLKTDRLWGRLLVSEEQNRISNEIHDGVSQYLFSMVCALHTLTQEGSRIQDDCILKQLRLLEDTARQASAELRASIYGLNPAKRGESLFVDNLALYLDELGRLNSIQVDLQAEGSEDLLSPALRKGLYRIVREACSNAIRHGHCSQLKVALGMTPVITVLEVEDNGCAFMGETANSWSPGLGIKNMKQIAARFDGKLEIKSQAVQGTLVRCSVPRSKIHTESLKEAFM